MLSPPLKGRLSLAYGERPGISPALSRGYSPRPFRGLSPGPLSCPPHARLGSGGCPRTEKILYYLLLQRGVQNFSSASGRFALYKGLKTIPLSDSEAAATTQPLNSTRLCANDSWPGTTRHRGHAASHHPRTQNCCRGGEPLPRAHCGGKGRNSLWTPSGLFAPLASPTGMWPPGSPRIRARTGIDPPLPLRDLIFCAPAPRLPPAPTRDGWPPKNIAHNNNKNAS